MRMAKGGYGVPTYVGAVVAAGCFEEQEDEDEDMEEGRGEASCGVF